MKPIRVKAWACSNCNRTFIDNEHGKNFAEDCCKCRTCKGPSEYFGGSPTCRKCNAKRELVEAAKNLEYAEERLKKAHSEAKSQGVGEYKKK